MRRVRLLIALIFTVLCSARGADLEEVPTDVETLRYHLRLGPLRTSDVHTTLFWNYTDSANYRALEFCIPAITSEDPLTGFIAPWSLVERTAGNDSIIAKGTAISAYNSGAQQGFSAVLSVTATSASVSLGGARISTIIPVNFRHTDADSIGYQSARSLTELRNDIRLVPRRNLEASAINSIDSLKRRIASSADPNEAFWTYLDRDTEPALAALGGTYTLATVRESDSSYSILYISGAKAAAAAWPPLRVKGRLLPTIFDKHFDLLWVEPSGHLLDDELSADIELEGNILSLHFPLHRSKVRFRRIPRENI